jgi:acyl-CoA thioester hydrolase
MQPILQPLAFRGVPFSHTHRLRVRYSECDMQGHVFNAHWLSYFDLAVTELWRAAVGPWAQVLARGIDLVVVEASVSYRSPARFDDEVAIAATVERLGTTSIVTAFRAHRDEELLVEGRLIHVVVDRETYAKRLIPDWVRERLE